MKEPKTKQRKFYNRVRGILKKEVNAKNTTATIKIFAMPILRYGFGILKWTRDELETMDQKIRKILYQHKFHHPQSSTHRLYLSQEQGGRGMSGVRDVYQQECSSLAKYIEENENDPLIKIVKEAEKRKKYGLTRYIEPKNNKNTEETDKEHYEGLKEMKMHGDYFKQQEEMTNIDLNKSKQWLNKANLRFETESLLCAAQEQAVSTRYMTNKIWGMGNEPKC